MPQWPAVPDASAYAPASMTPPHRPRRRRLAAGLAGVFAAGLVGGVLVSRAASTSPGTTASLIAPATPSPSSSSSSSSSTSDGSSGGSSGANTLTQGVVDVNVSLSGGGRAAGTGIVITSSGEVLTNNHVIADESAITVQVTTTGATYSAHVVGYDVTDDIALLQIDGGSNFRTVQLGNSANLSVGQAVTEIGNALGQGGTPAITSGSITTLNQTITASDGSGGNEETLGGTIQTDAQIQPRDSR